MIKVHPYYRFEQDHGLNIPEYVSNQLSQMRRWFQAKLFDVQIITMVTRTTMEVIMEVSINLAVTNLKSPRLNPSLMEEV